jgi:hypothetical protein
MGEKEASKRNHQGVWEDRKATLYSFVSLCLYCICPGGEGEEGAKRTCPWTNNGPRRNDSVT